MKWLIGGALITALVVWGGCAGVAQAEIAGPVIQTEGPVTAVSMDALTFSISGPAGVQEFHVTPMTSIFAGPERIDFNRMPEFLGVAAIVWSAPNGSDQIAGFVTLLVYPARGIVPGTVIGGGESETAAGGPNGGGGGGNNGGGGGGGGGGGYGQHDHGEHGNSGWADNNTNGQGGERNNGRDNGKGNDR